MERRIDDNHRIGNTVTAGVLLLTSGLTINFLLERHNFLAVWVNSPYPVPSTDLFYPVLCVFLSLTGIVLVVGGTMRRTTIRKLRSYVFAVAVPLTVIYTLFVFGMQFISSGADRLGECPGFYDAAASSHVIPESQWRPHQPAIGCGVQRRGIFLSYYNDIGIDGVTEAAEQQQVLDRIAEHFRQAHTHPVQVMFRERGTWSVRQGKNGATFGSGRPGRLIRVVNIG
jgi:hypothetical protein